VVGSDEEPLEAQLRELDRQRGAGEVSELAYNLRRNQLLAQTERARAAVAGPVGASPFAASAVPATTLALESAPPLLPLASERDGVLVAAQVLAVIQGLLGAVEASSLIRAEVQFNNAASAVGPVGSVPSAIYQALQGLSGGTTSLGFGFGVLVVALLVVITGIRAGHGVERTLLVIWQTVALVVTLLAVAGPQDFGSFTTFVFYASGYPLVELGVVLASQGFIICAMVIHTAAPRAFY
jgi:hypothetical protein